MKNNLLKNIIILTATALLMVILLMCKAYQTSWTPDCFLYVKGGINVATGDFSGGLGKYVE